MYSTEVSKTLVSVWLNNILVDHSMQNTFQFSRIRCVEEDLTSFLTKFSLELIFLNCFKNWVNHFQRRIERYSVTTTIRYKKNVIKNWRQNTSQQWQRRRRRQKRLNDARSRSTRLIVFSRTKKRFYFIRFFLPLPPFRQTARVCSFDSSVWKIQNHDLFSNLLLFCKCGQFPTSFLHFYRFHRVNSEASIVL